MLPIVWSSRLPQAPRTTGLRQPRSRQQATNDLAKAVAYCRERGWRNPAVLGACGRREDHAIGNIFRALEFGLEIITDHGRFVPVCGRRTFCVAPGTAISVFAPDPATRMTSRGLEWPLDRAIAEALWVAIVTDSGRFAYDSTRPGTLRAACDLLRYGVRTAPINDILYCSFAAKAVELKRRAWRSLHIWKNRKVAEVSLTRDDFREVRGTKADAEDVIEIPRQVARNEIALFFYQIPDRTHETRVSIRTRDPWDATLLATRFGGGGHLRAAGCTIKGSMGVAKRQMRRAVREMLKGDKVKSEG